MKLTKKNEIEELMIDHENQITQDLIIEALQRFDITTHSDDFKKATHLIFDISEIVSKILDWLENDLNIKVYTRQVLIYGHNQYASTIVKNAGKIDSYRVEIKAIDKINDREILFADFNQCIFATFKYVLENIKEYKEEK